MKTPALVAVEAEPSAFASLFAASRARGARIGWLELSSPPTPGGALEQAAGLGAMRAVAAGGGRVVAVKPVGGSPVLRDLLREHFLGCALVLVRGHEGYPRLSPTEAGYRLELAGDSARVLEAEAVLGELRRPRHRS